MEWAMFGDVSDFPPFAWKSRFKDDSNQMILFSDVLSLTNSFCPTSIEDAKTPAETSQMCSEGIFRSK